MAGNPARAWDDGNFPAPYVVRVSSRMTSMQPFDIPDTDDPSTHIPSYANIILEFADPVRVGDQMLKSALSGVSVCDDWTDDRDCEEDNLRAFRSDHVHFLGNKVLINPAIDLELGKTYHLFVSDESISYFSGIRPAGPLGRRPADHQPSTAAVMFEYYFQVNLNPIETIPPRLVAVIADCDGDGDQDTRDACDRDGDGMTDLQEDQLRLAPGLSPMVPVSTRFRLHFDEEIEMKGRPTLLEEGGEPFSRVLDWSTVSHSNATHVDHMVVYSPPLRHGRHYTLVVGGGEICDRVSYRRDVGNLPPNFFPGTNFSFVTPVGRAEETFPADGAANVDHTVALLLNFSGRAAPGGPQPGSVGSAADRFITIRDELSGEARAIPWDDSDQVQYFANRVRVSPEPPLRQGRAYTFRFPHQALRFGTPFSDVTIRFRTRPEDFRPPEVLGFGLRLQAAPYARYSETVVPQSGRSIRLFEDGAPLVALDVAAAVALPCDAGSSDGCAELSETGTLLTVFPRGKGSDGRAAPWSQAGRSYRLELEAGAFLDEAQRANPSAAVAHDFGLLDPGGPTTTTASADTGLGGAAADQVPPAVHSFLPPRDRFGSATLTFWEAVQVTQDASGYDMVISGNKVSLRAAGGADWGADTTLQLPAASLADAAGNRLAADLTFSFSVSADTAPPTPTQLPANGAVTTDRTAIVALAFDEAVQLGSGSVSFYADGALVTQMDVATLPLVEERSSTDHRRSFLVVDPRQVLEPGVGYSFRVPSTALADVARNNMSELNGSFSVSELKEHVRPALLATSIGSPAAAFESDVVELYFSEAVQDSGSGAMRLAPSDGGSLCGSLENFTCAFGETCREPCDYEAASQALDLRVRELRGCRATLAVAGAAALEPERGYRLEIAAGRFLDAAASYPNAMDAVPSGLARLHVLRTAPARPASEAAPRLASSAPADGDELVAPSTLLVLTFTQTVQAGGGGLLLGGSLLAPEACAFEGSSVTCGPAPGGLPGASEVRAEWPPDFVRSRHLGVPLRASDTRSLSFRTHTSDVFPPRVVAASVGGAPFSLQAHATREDPGGMAHTAVVELTFSEVVQAGAGSLQVLDCTPGIPWRCFDGVRETTPDAATPVLSVDVTDRSDQGLIYDGRRVLLVHPALPKGTLFSLETDTNGAFLDVPGNALPRIQGGFEWSTATEDDSKPFVQRFFPDAPWEQRAPFSTGLGLWFSEAVQVAGSSLAEYIYVQDSEDPEQHLVPIDNSQPAAGTLSVPGRSAVAVALGRPLTPAARCDVHFRGSTFKDLSGNSDEGAGFSTPNAHFSFYVDAFEARPLQPPASADGGSARALPSRAGARLHRVGSKWLSLGGWTGDDCTAEVHASTDGAAWDTVVGPAGAGGASPPSPGAVRGAATAVDAQGCLWLLGGQCSGQGTATLWRTCDAARTWTALPAPQTATPLEGMRGAAARPWPASFEGHAMAVAGPWHLVVVDARRGLAWKFVEQDMSTVVVATLPFGARTDPSVVSTPDGSLFMSGGQTWPTAEGGRALGDVWRSDDGGLSWRCLAADAFAGGTALSSASALAAHDGTLLAMGLQATAQGRVGLYEAVPGPPDVTPPRLLLREPLADAAGVPLLNFSGLLVFSEAVQAVGAAGSLAI